MKIGRKTIAGGIAAAVVVFGAYKIWDITRFRTANYSCSDGAKTISLTPSGGGAPIDGEFYMYGWISRGELTIAGFPPGDPAEKPLHFAPDATISEAHRGEWYDDVDIRFEPSRDATPPELPNCYVRIVYRFGGILFSELTD